jgi:hypothetical protein
MSVTWGKKMTDDTKYFREAMLTVTMRDDVRFCDLSREQQSDVIRLAQVLKDAAGEA